MIKMYPETLTAKANPLFSFLFYVFHLFIYFVIKCQIIMKFFCFCFSYEIRFFIRYSIIIIIDR